MIMQTWQYLFTVKKTQHCEMASAVNQVGEGKPETADIIIIESPIGDQKVT